MIWDPDPVLLTVGGLQLSMLSLYWGLAILYAFAVFRWRSIQSGRDFEDLSELLTISILLVFGASRVVPLVGSDLGSLGSEPLETLFDGDFSAEGAALGLLYSCLIFSNEKGERWRRVLDWMTPGVLGATAILSLGQFFSIQEIGRQSDVAWAVSFPGFDSSDVATPRRHPIRVYELFGVLVMMLALLAGQRVGGFQRAGRAAGFAIAGYFTLSVGLSPWKSPADRVDLLELCLGAILISFGAWMFVSPEPDPTS